MKKKILTVLLIAVAIFLAGQLYTDKKIPADCPVLIGDKEVALGMDEKEVFEAFGEPYDVVPSEYGFDWNIYHENYKNYVQIGLNDNKVVAVFTNSPDLVFEGIYSGEEKGKINEKLGQPLDGIVKDTARYLANGKDIEIYEIRGGYVTFFYDAYKNNSLVSVNIIDYDIEQGFKKLYAPGTDALRRSFEKQNFYVTNAERVKAGLPHFKPHQELDEVAYRHSCDMVENGYFAHQNKKGENVLERAKKYEISFKSIGENLAMGAQNPLYLNHLLMNSEGHRKNILGDFTHMGVGVAFDDKDTPYMTQNFLK